MQTLHIFDEFQKLVEHLTEKERHKKRVELEKLIFSILKMNYGKYLQDFWNSYNPPRESKKQIILIERRIHENLEFILQNAAWAGQEGCWSLAIICSDINLNYVKSIVGNKSVKIIPFFHGNPDAEQAKKEYNEILQSSEFYQLFSADFLCTVEMDCYFRKQIPDSVITCDYIASPYAWNHYRAGGGLSFRKREVMLEICKNKSVIYPCQDIYVSDGICELGYSMPPLLYSKEICAESILNCDPVGVHQWWTFFSPKLEDAENIFHTFMKLEINNEK